MNQPKKKHLSCQNTCQNRQNRASGAVSSKTRCFFLGRNWTNKTVNNVISLIWHNEYYCWIQLANILYQREVNCWNWKEKLWFCWHYFCKSRTSIGFGNRFSNLRFASPLHSMHKQNDDSFWITNDSIIWWLWVRLPAVSSNLNKVLALNHSLFVTCITVMKFISFSHKIINISECITLFCDYLEFSL